MACTACGQCMGIASSGDGERNAVRVHARCVSGRPADDQPVASDVKHTSCFFDVSACCCVSACARRWRGSHAGSVCVERAVHACARVQGAGQRVCVRHARRRLGKPGARHASCRILPAGKKGKLFITPLRASGKKVDLAPRAVVDLAAQSLCRTQQSGVSRCLPAVQLPHHRAVYRHGQKRTHSCAYISATTSPASGCKAICESCIFASR